MKHVNETPYRRREMTRRAWLAGAAGGAAIVPLLAACSVATKNSGPAASAEVSGQVVHWSIPSFPFQEDVGADLAKEFRAKYPKIEYAPQTITGDRVAALVTAAAAGTAPDIGMAGSYQTQELAATGIARALDDYFKASSVVKQADLWPSHVKDMTYKGKPYGMPFGPDDRVMFVNSGVMGSAGLDAAKPAPSWDELEPTFGAFTDKGRPCRWDFQRSGGVVAVPSGRSPSGSWAVTS